MTRLVIKAQEIIPMDELEMDEMEFSDDVKEGGGLPKKDEILDWFLDNPKPSDKEVHDWAEGLGVSYEDLEASIFELVGEYAKKLNEESGEEEDFDDDFEEEEE